VDNLLTTAGYATTNDPTMNECYYEQFLLIKNQEATTNEEEYYWLK